jgi:hypothetical protein
LIIQKVSFESFIIDLPDYQVIDNSLPHRTSNVSIWKNRRRSDQQMLERNSSTLSNKSTSSKIGPLSQRISLYRKKHSRPKFNSKTNSSVVFTRRKFGGLIEEKGSINIGPPSMVKEVSRFSDTTPPHKDINDYMPEYSSVSPVVTINKPPQSNFGKIKLNK